MRVEHVKAAPEQAPERDAPRPITLPKLRLPKLIRDELERIR
jgi:hypothetical protein